MGLFKDRRRRRSLGTHEHQDSGGTTAGSHPRRDDDPLSDAQLRIDVEQVLARELGGLVIADTDSARTPAPVSKERVLAWITEYGYSSFVDSDGDLGGIWHSRLFYFLLFGGQTEILQVRGQWNREITIDRIEEVLDFCNEWNTDRIWPKAYFRVRDNGMIQVYGEVSVDFEHGVTDDQLDRTLSCGLSTAAMLFDTLDARYPDPARSAP